MDVIFLLMALVCLAGVMSISMGNDFLIFPKNGKMNPDEFNVPKVYAAEKVLLSIDAACSLVVALGLALPVVEWIVMGVFALTLPIHVYVFKAESFKKKG